MSGTCPEILRINSRTVENKSGDEVPCVGVLMSTYNGERYLREQIDSIAAQKGVKIEMFVRDDGSSDSTIDILRDMSSNQRGSIVGWHIEYGDNIGFLGSFERLLAIADGCDGYCFSDQDDFWLPEKLQVAMRQLRRMKGPALYASAVIVVDEHLDEIGRNNFPNYAYSIPAEFIRHRLPGHTMVWNGALHCFINDTINFLPCWTHDQRVVISALLVDAPLYLDETSYVLHRRLNTSVTPGGTGICKRFRHEFRVVWNPGRIRNRPALARAILEFPDISLDDSDKHFLQMCAMKKRVAFACGSHFDCGLIAGNLEARISILLGRF